MTETAYRDYLARQDVKWYDGASATFSRKTSTGGTHTVTKFGDTIDVLAAFGDGIRKTATELNQAITSAGSNNVAFEIARGNWDISGANVTFPSNAIIIFHPGAVLVVSSGKTLTINSAADIVANPNHQIFSGAGTITITNPGEVYPDWWGCAGDGSTDDTTNFDKMIDSLPAGSIVRINADKTYTLSAITADEQIKFIGNGTLKQIDSGASDNTPFITVSVDNVHFIGITINGNSANQGATTGADLIRFSNGADYCKVIGCKLHNSTGYCISTQGVTYLTIKDNLFLTWRAGNYQAVLISTNTSGSDRVANNIIIADNIMHGDTNGSSCIDISGNTTYAIYEVSITGNVIIVGDGPGTLGIQLYSSSGLGVYDVTIAGNVIKGENSTNTDIYGISCGGAAGASERAVTITGNTIKNCNFIGIEIGGATNSSVSGNTIDTAGTGVTGILAYTTKRTTISGNSISNVQYGISVYEEAATATIDNVISGNIITLLASTAGYGIFVQCNYAGATIYRHNITGNTVIGDNTASQYGIRFQEDAGTLDGNLVVGNYLYNLAYGLTRSGDAGLAYFANRFDTCDAHTELMSITHDWEGDYGI